MRRLLGIAVVGLIAAAPAAGAQRVITFFGGFGGPDRSPVSITNVATQFTGELTVNFRGDPASGCAAQGLCAYSGTVTFSPGSSANVAVARYRGAASQLGLDFAPGPGSAVNAAQVMRAGTGTCGDAREPEAGVQGTVSRGQASIVLLQPGGTLLSTRCAGPLDSDLAGLGPVVKLPVTELLRGHRTVDLSGSWSFSRGGFAGTIDSTLKLILGAPSTQRGISNPGFRRAVKTRRMRQLIESLDVTGGQGETTLGLAGDPATCEFLDSCQARGTLTANLNPQHGAGSLFVLGPASRPYRDFLAALGLSRRGNPHGLLLGGSVAWAEGGSLVQSGPCTSTAPFGDGLVTLTMNGRRLTANFATALLRTRCPGPVLAPEDVLATGVMTPGHPGRSLTLRLSGSGTITDDGYTTTQRTSLRLRLRRTGLKTITSY